MPINFLAVLIAAVASWFMGGAWYGAFGKHWIAAQGWTEDDIKGHGGKTPLGPMITSFIGELVMAAMLAGMLLHFGGGIRSGIIISVLIWIGFVATTISVNNAFSKRSFKLTLIDSGHWLFVLLVQGAVLGWMG